MNDSTWAPQQCTASIACPECHAKTGERCATDRPFHLARWDAWRVQLDARLGDAAPMDDLARAASSISTIAELERDSRSASRERNHDSWRIADIAAPRPTVILALIERIRELEALGNLALDGWQRYHECELEFTDEVALEILEQRKILEKGAVLP